MGANFSGNLYEDDDGSRGLDHMPENCVALVLSHLDPLEICVLAGLSRVFHAASSADFIWESKLPSNYRFMLDKVFDGDKKIVSLGKKDFYARLCRPNPFDGGFKEVWIDKKTGGLCLSISSKTLTITGIDDRRYWSTIATEESRFQTVAYLQQIWWLEVNGELEFQFPPGSYSLFFRLQLGRSSKRLGRKVCNTEHIHGWNIKPVRFELTTSDGQHSLSQCFLDNPGKWAHYHAGDFVVQHPNETTKIKFSLTQIDCTHTKGGLCVDAVYIYPCSIGSEICNM